MGRVKMHGSRCIITRFQFTKTSSSLIDLLPSGLCCSSSVFSNLAPRETQKERPLSMLLTVSIFFTQISVSESIELLSYCCSFLKPSRKGGSIAFVKARSKLSKIKYHQFAIKIKFFSHFSTLLNDLIILLSKIISVHFNWNQPAY